MKLFFCPKKTLFISIVFFVAWNKNIQATQVLSFHLPYDHIALSSNKFSYKKLPFFKNTSIESLSSSLSTHSPRHIPHIERKSGHHTMLYDDYSMKQYSSLPLSSPYDVDFYFIDSVQSSSSLYHSLPLKEFLEKMQALTLTTSGLKQFYLNYKNHKKVLKKLLWPNSPLLKEEKHKIIDMVQLGEAIHLALKHQPSLGEVLQNNEKCQEEKLNLLLSRMSRKENMNIRSLSLLPRTKSLPDRNNEIIEQINGLKMANQTLKEEVTKLKHSYFLLKRTLKDKEEEIERISKEQTYTDNRYVELHLRYEELEKKHSLLQSKKKTPPSLKKKNNYQSKYLLIRKKYQQEKEKNRRLNLQVKELERKVSPFKQWKKHSEKLSIELEQERSKREALVKEELKSRSCSLLKAEKAEKKIILDELNSLYQTIILLNEKKQINEKKIADLVEVNRLLEEDKKHTGQVLNTYQEKEKISEKQKESSNKQAQNLHRRVFWRRNVAVLALFLFLCYIGASNTPLVLFIQSKTALLLFWLGKQWTALQEALHHIWKNSKERGIQ